LEDESAGEGAGEEGGRERVHLPALANLTLPKVGSQIWFWALHGIPPSPNLFSPQRVHPADPAR